MEGNPTVEGVSTADGEKSHLQNSSRDALSEKNGETQETGQEEHQYVTGLKLALIMSAITVTFFLAMLDLAIIATVSKHRLSCCCV